MHKAYKYRIYPTEPQKRLLQKTFDCCRLVYNLALETRIAVYRANGTTLSAFDLFHQLTDLKKECPYLTEVDSQALQYSISCMDAAFSNFLKKHSRFPRFKSKRNSQSFSCPNSTRRVDFDKSLLTIPKIKNIAIKLSRRFEGKIKRVTITKTATGKYYAAILVDCENNPCSTKITKKADCIVGIDMGLKHFAILSDGTKVENPKFLGSSLNRLKCLHRRLAKKQKRSKNREKARRRIASIHEKIANQRKDFLHKLSTAITKQYDTVCVESLQISNMLKNRSLSRAISDVGWGEFLRQLKYKMDWKGGTVLELPAFYPSSKRCSSCGEKNENLTLRDREWTCLCGVSHDRDFNAAINIKNYFLTERYSGRACGDADNSLVCEAGKSYFSSMSTAYQV